jgi:hypothetical protein
MESAFEELAKLVGRALAERWLQSRKATAADCNATVMEQTRDNLDSESTSQRSSRGLGGITESSS